MEITTKGKIKNADGTFTERSITVAAPRVLELTTIKDLVETLGEELAVAKINAQLTIDFRASQRTLAESVDDNGDIRHDDDAIAAMDFSDWVPTLRIRKSVEEKAASLLSTMTPDQIKAALAMLQSA
jgi:hypothetical protein